MTKDTGLVKHPGREQPWTVWLRGDVLGFDESKPKALARLMRALLFDLEKAGKLTPVMRQMAEAEIARA